MKELSKVFNGVTLPIQEIDQELYFDVSGIAKKYGKKLNEWEKLENTKEYMLVIEREKNGQELSPVQENIKFVIKQGQQAFLHREVFVLFARWINIKFAVWSDRLIIKILTDKTHLIENQLRATELENKKMHNKIYGKERGDYFETSVYMVREYDIAITPHELNQIMCKEGYLSVVINEKPKYFSEVMSRGVPLLHVDTVLRIIDKLGIKRGTGYSDTHPPLF